LAGRGVVETRNNGKQTHNLNNKPPRVWPRQTFAMETETTFANSGGPGR
jgi:hypothetical protein